MHAQTQPSFLLDPKFNVTWVTCTWVFNCKSFHAHTRCSALNHHNCTTRLKRRMCLQRCAQPAIQCIAHMPRRPSRSCLQKILNHPALVLPVVLPVLPDTHHVSLTLAGDSHIDGVVQVARWAASGDIIPCWCVRKPVRQNVLVHRPYSRRCHSQEFEHEVQDSLLATVWSIEDHHARQ